MKNIFSSGVSARVKRRLRLMTNGLTLVMIAVAMTLATRANVSGIQPVAQCFPSNDRLAGPLRPFMNAMVGAVGGIIPMLAAALVIVGVVVGLIMVFKKEDVSNIIKVIVLVPSVVLIGILMMIVFLSIYAIANQQCPSTPF